MQRPMRVLIVDDQTLLREGFRKLIELEPDLEVVGSAGDGEEALAMTAQLYEQQQPPAVILMDIRMPRMDGITATRRFKERWPAINIVILTTFDEDELIREGLQAGALGYLLKDITSEQLAETIRAAARGQLLLQSNIATKILSALSGQRSVPAGSITATHAGAESSATISSIDELTEREREILTLVAQGASNREISETLYITNGTVKNHLSNILSKLGVRDRTQAALKARELGLG